MRVLAWSMSSSNNLIYHLILTSHHSEDLSDISAEAQSLISMLLEPDPLVR